MSNLLMPGSLDTNPASMRNELGGFGGRGCPLLHLLRQAGHGELKLVLAPELGRCPDRFRRRKVSVVVDCPVFVADGRQVEQVVEAAHVLLDDLHHRVLDRGGEAPGYVVLICTEEAARSRITARSASVKIDTPRPPIGVGICYAIRKD